MYTIGSRASLEVLIEAELAASSTELLIRWELDLSTGQKEVLVKHTNGLIVGPSLSSCVERHCGHVHLRCTPFTDIQARLEGQTVIGQGWRGIHSTWQSHSVESLRTAEVLWIIGQMGVVSQSISISDGFTDSHTQSCQRSNVRVNILGLRCPVHLSFNRWVLHSFEFKMVNSRQKAERVRI
ncbi:hypothetical protein PUMCH_003995 [Australozyma saopauloensis]|uniref:Uncharacterized protein n=1 Tax=Australozyma saopauloensis TaxID=291208 RepID=A0AAX4HDU0_9ASCO|nr:hypothetical protein PUMCH_003995 [[Candida] saopauloensis]